VAAVLALIAIGALARVSAAEEARASTHSPPAGSVAAAGPDTLLGALSFTSSREPIAVSADTLEVDYRARLLKYTGNVVVTQGDMRLSSNSLTVTLDDAAADRVKEVVADGQVRLSQGERWASGGHAVFDEARNTVVLSDNAELHDGPNEVKGDRVKVFLNEQRSVVEGGKGRVTAKLFPSEGKATPAGGRAP
jgi:lipopolysaccharide export system protein LptA